MQNFAYHLIKKTGTFKGKFCMAAWPDEDVLWYLWNRRKYFECQFTVSF